MADEHPAPWRWTFSRDNEEVSLDAANGDQVIGPSNILDTVWVANARVRALTEAAPEMEAVLREMEFKTEGARTDTRARVCYFCLRTRAEGHLADCGYGRVLARIDERSKG